MNRVTIDTSELDAFAVTLDQLPSKLARHATPVLKKAAQNVKEDLQADFQGSSNQGFRGIARKISYDDPTLSAAGAETEVGIDKGGAGNLGNLAVFGSWKGGGTHNHPAFYAEQELPSFADHLARLAEELL